MKSTRGVITLTNPHEVKGGNALSLGGTLQKLTTAVFHTSTTSSLPFPLSAALQPKGEGTRRVLRLSRAFHALRPPPLSHLLPSFVRRVSY